MKHYGFFNKIRVLHKNEIAYKFKFFFLSKLGLLKTSIKNIFDIKATKINIFNDSIFIEHKDEFINQVDYEKLLINIGYSNKCQNKYWYKISLSDFNGDIREFWEFNRLQFLNNILNQYLATKKQVYLDQINTFLAKWFSVNPLEKGFCHVSNLEIAIRALVFYRLWYYLSESLSVDLKKVLYVYGWHLYKDLPRTNACVPNNHSLGEATSLYLLSKVFNNNKWEKLSVKTIYKRFDLFSFNGESIEESSGYLLFKTQMLIFLRNIGGIFNNDIDILLPKIFSQLQLLSDVDNNVATFGDCDDGLFYSFGLTNKNSLNQLSIIHFKNFKIFDNLLEKSKHLKFNYSNYLLGISNKQTKVALLGGREVNHGHNQCLSIFIWHNGKQLVFSPGTYRYNDVSFSKRLYYSGLDRQNCPRTIDRSNLVTTFRHLKVINKVDLYNINDTLYGIMFLKHKRIVRKVKISENKVIVSDFSKDKLEKISICCDEKCSVSCKNGIISKEMDLFSKTYGLEEIKEYTSIIPSCNHYEFVIELK